eukprot:CAMPEP_0201571144 /NCGR_PEP_ID=MMETSP0190_2-20130828/13766_1 /ASSEMBLY_ACC=CAM_ASM_000263 /TAXON_ID=37353 /ORGANISM="Rosalina sp." /LENGTH=361 /DNA_ID=CAMNT_0047995467 /DNA_START=96 /DNA_END=1177 /DNA_ORIENTATION=+
MKLRKDLLSGIFSYGWEKPSELQQRAIIPMIERKNIAVQGLAGTGKSGAFSIASLEIIDLDNPQCQILIISPTREIARQIFDVLSALGSNMIHNDGLTIYKCIGGISVRESIDALKQEQKQIVVGTPGKVNDIISRGALGLKALKLFVLDQTDEILYRGFKEQICDTFQYIPSKVQVALFSATIPNEIKQLIERFMSNPVRIFDTREELTLDGIKQYYVAVEKEDYKLETLFDLFEVLTITQAIIYCNTRRKVIWLTDKMKQCDFTVSSMHGDMFSTERESMMREFRSGSTRVLIATDLLARGIDVSTVPLVINYDLPRNKEDYIHRICRKGAYGRKGCAINFVGDEDEPKLRDIETFYNT